MSGVNGAKTTVPPSAEPLDDVAGDDDVAVVDDEAVAVDEVAGAGVERRRGRDR